MKCAACGHDEGERHKNFKKEDFLEIIGYFRMQGEPDDYSDGTEEVDLYACPKCSTILMKRRMNF